MTGSIVNAVAVVIGALIGLFFKKGVNQKLQDALFKSIGLAVIIIGLNGVISNMFKVNETGAVSSSGELLLVVSLAVGTVLGEIVKLDVLADKFSKKIENKLKIGDFSTGFISASTIFCVGAMAIIGAINDGVLGDSTVLFTKSLLDFTVSIILASALGYGVLFSAIPVFLYQGSISVFAHYLNSFLVGELLQQICMIGYVIVITIGLNFIFPEKFKSINMLPAIFIPIIYKLIQMLF